MSKSGPRARGTALVTGVGPGLGAAICRRLVRAGYAVAGLARSSSFGKQLQAEIGPESRFRFYDCDVTNVESVNETSVRARRDLGSFEVLVHNASTIVIAPFAETKTADFEKLWRVTCLGAVLSSQAVLPDMLAARSGSIIITGATASLRGGANFAAFASAKFALRGLAQSLAREHGKNGIHVAHAIVDGLIWAQKARDRFDAKEDDCLKPESIAEQYLNLIEQDPSAWTHELDLRPYGENF